MKSTGQGRFRSVPFWIYKEQRSRSGRRVVRREYPLREHGGADDLGKKLPEHTFTLSLTGDDAQAQRVRLTQALNAPGPGELLPPDWGTLRCWLIILKAATASITSVWWSLPSRWCRFPMRPPLRLRKIPQSPGRRHAGLTLFNPG